uniref:Uncharacterized protein n=1 Tax=Photinus pyralis TaxID=7054 RepID=A0A1Y1NJF3_PHOPY
MSHLQSTVGRGLSALGPVLTKLLNKESIIDINTLIPDLVDVSKFMGQTHYLLWQHRRHMVYPKLNPSIQKVAKDCPLDSYLFGENLTDRCKAAQSLQKSCLEMRAAPAKSFDKTQPSASKNRSAQPPRSKYKKPEGSAKSKNQDQRQRTYRSSGKKPSYSYYRNNRQRH